MDLDEATQKILTKVLAFLAYRPRNKKEVGERLARYLKSAKGLDEAKKAQVTTQILAYLDQHQLVNDEEFARLYVEAKTKGQHILGKRAILVKLMQKGLSKEAASTYVANWISQADEVNNAGKLLLRKYKVPDPQTRDAMIRYLLSRGFSFPIVKQAVDYFLKRP